MKALHLLTASAAILMASATAVYADHHERGPRGGKDFFERLDADKDGKISLQEHQAASEARFKRIDKDGDGYITKEEHEAHRAEMREKFKERKKERKEQRGERKPKGE